MSDLIKAPVQLVYLMDVFGCQWHARQTNWRGSEKPNRINVSFKKGAKEITSRDAPNQPRFGTEYFLAYTLPDFKSMMLTQLSAEQKGNGPLLFSLMGQCFQDVGLTDTIFFCVQVCFDPWTVLRQPDLQRYLFFSQESYVFMFLCKKIFLWALPKPTLLLTIRAHSLNQPHW